MKYDLYAKAMWGLFNGSFKNELLKVYSEDRTSQLMKKAKGFYKEIVLRTPSIGGMKNAMTINILDGALLVAIYKAADGDIQLGTLERIFSDGMENGLLFKTFMKKKAKCFTKQWQDKRNKMSLESQKRKYSFDWVSEFIYGKTTNEHGINFYECGICKVLNKEGVPELIPMMCRFDYVMVKYMGAELTRTKTIGGGDELCDFWYKKC